MEKIRVVSIDDHHLIHEAIRSLLDDEENIQLVADGYAGEDVLRLVEYYRPHILILDLMMPQVKDDELDSERFLALPMLERLHQEFPAMGIIILSQYLHYEIAQVAIQNGVRGYLLKSDNLSLYLATAIKQVHRGQIFFSQAFSRELFRQSEKPTEEILTLRQKQIILAVAKSPDVPYSQVAEALGISHRTLKGHLDGAYKSLNVSNLTACVIRSMQLGLIPFSHNGKGIVFGNL